MSSLEKVTIFSLEGSKITVEAQYNPKELSFSKSVQYDDKSGDRVDYPTLYFTTGQAITLSVEFFFDRYEAVGEKKDVRNDVSALVKLCHIDSSLGRPPMVQIIWGGGNPLFKDGSFTGVLTDASVKYTMFSGSVPVRASVTVSIKQADIVRLKEQKDDGTYDDKKGTETSLSRQSLSGVSVQDVSNNDALRDAIIRAGGDPADKSTWPDEVNVASSSAYEDPETGGTE